MTREGLLLRRLRDGDSDVSARLRRLIQQPAPDLRLAILQRPVNRLQPRFLLLLLGRKPPHLHERPALEPVLPQQPLLRRLYRPLPALQPPDLLRLQLPSALHGLQHHSANRDNRQLDLEPRATARQLSESSLRVRRRGKADLSRVMVNDVGLSADGVPAIV